MYHTTTEFLSLGQISTSALHLAKLQSLIIDIVCTWLLNPAKIIKFHINSCNSLTQSLAFLKIFKSVCYVNKDFF